MVNLMIRSGDECIQSRSGPWTKFRLQVGGKMPGTLRDHNNTAAVL